MSTSTTAESPTYLPFGTGKLHLVQEWKGEVAELAGGGAGGRLREVKIYQEGDGPLTRTFLLENLYNSPDDLVTAWQKPEDSRVLREKLSLMLFGEGPEKFKFHFRWIATDSDGTFSVIVGDTTGMVRARRLIARDEADMQARRCGYGPA